MNAPWYIALLRGLRIQRAVDAPLVAARFRTRKTAALLAFLAVHPDCAHPREDRMCD